MNNSRKETLEAIGFRTGEIILPGLNIKVTLEPNQYFFFDGQVDSIEENDRNWAEILKVDYEDVSSESENVVGKYLYRKLGDEYNLAIVYYLKEDNKKEEILTIGHESTHILFRFGLEHKLLEALEKEGFNFNPLTYFNDEEDIAEAGGVLSSYKLQKGSIEHFSELMDLRFAAMAYMEQSQEMMRLLY
ncbi:hypothetical protein HOC06_01380 [Candidatus Woesearchaeota archaeon]|jgi:hypothetical protein|nr:hypothetical protein [Candidatus Woesearchaeota archaeon]MBT4630857.1 hypothetical protein [Candidatus Woesearchaeota archaeon]